MVSNLTTIQQIKEKVEEFLAVPTEIQRLVFKGKILKDFQTVSACQITEMEILDLFFSDKIIIFVLTLLGSTIPFEVSKKNA